MIDLQDLINTMNDLASKERGNYHLTYGDLVNVLKAAPPDAVFDERVTGIGSYRGYYTDIALFTQENGFTCSDEEYDYNSGFENYAKWEQEHTTYCQELPKNANELGALLESIIGQDFIGYKGGNFTISEDTPLWLEGQSNEVSQLAVTGIDNNLKLQTKVIE